MAEVHHALTDQHGNQWLKGGIGGRIKARLHHACSNNAWDGEGEVVRGWGGGGGGNAVGVRRWGGGERLCVCSGGGGGGEIVVAVSVF